MEKKLSSQNDALSVQHTSTPSSDVTVPVSPAQEETLLEKATLFHASLEQPSTDPISSELDVLPQAGGMNLKMIAPSLMLSEESMDMQYSEAYLSGSIDSSICQDYGAVQKEGENICVFPDARECPIDLLDACFFI